MGCGLAEVMTRYSFHTYPNKEEVARLLTATSLSQYVAHPMAHVGFYLASKRHDLRAAKGGDQV